MHVYNSKSAYHIEIQLHVLNLYTAFNSIEVFGVERWCFFLSESHISYTTHWTSSEDPQCLRRVFIPADSSWSYLGPPRTPTQSILHWLLAIFTSGKPSTKKVSNGFFSGLLIRIELLCLGAPKLIGKMAGKGIGLLFRSRYTSGGKSQPHIVFD